MPRFRLKSPTMAIHRFTDGRRESILLPLRAEIEIVVVPDGIRPTNWLIDVHWRGQPVSMFLVDLLERGERIDGGV